MLELLLSGQDCLIWSHCIDNFIHCFLASVFLSVVFLSYVVFELSSNRYVQVSTLKTTSLFWVMAKAKFRMLEEVTKKSYKQFIHIDLYSRSILSHKINWSIKLTQQLNSYVSSQKGERSGKRVRYMLSYYRDWLAWSLPSPLESWCIMVASARWYPRPDLPKDLLLSWYLYSSLWKFSACSEKIQRPKLLLSDMQWHRGFFNAIYGFRSYRHTLHFSCWRLIHSYQHIYNCSRQGYVEKKVSSLQIMCCLLQY